jgi:hypothetical protein
MLKQEKSIYVPDTEHGLGDKNNILGNQGSID